MSIVTLSSKYQIVIPKEVRRKLRLTPGQKIRVTGGENGEAVIRTGSVVDELRGSMKGAWGSNSDEYLRKLRDEANRDRT
ncbi:AbrB/MazE/SpoVT family DNA-binding domain-containing protein [Candidatus Saccharibacteria bacterium]|nr:AbrB/MazE/SpoVT family DNA-binding domain-containing protein [Candidatus Saccharibacteria bacterium]